MSLALDCVLDLGWDSDSDWCTILRALMRLASLGGDSLVRWMGFAVVIKPTSMRCWLYDYWCMIGRRDYVFSSGGLLLGLGGWRLYMYYIMTTISR